MNGMFATVKRGLLLSIGLFFLVDASQNTPSVQNQLSAAPVAAAVPVVKQNVLPAQQVVPVQQTQPLVAAQTPSTPVPIQQPVAQPIVQGLTVQSAVQPAVQQNVSTSVQPAPAIAPVVTPNVKPNAAPQPIQTNVPVQQPLAPQVPSAQPVAEVAVKETSEVVKQEAPQSELIDKENQPSVESAKSNGEQIPTAPAQVIEEKVDVPVVEVKKPAVASIGEGIDTLEQEGGNWLLKRQALEKTIDVIEKIKDIFTKILETRVDYLVKRNKTDRSFDTFANSIGFELGDLNQLLVTLVKQLKSQRVQEGDLSEEERTVLQEVEDKITELKSLKSTVKSITEMDALLDEVLMQLEKEITTSNSYQTRAWKNFQTIKKVLSDEKAEELYLQTESLLKNMQEILKYLNGDLMQYFNGLIDTLKQNMNDTKEKIKTLETKGIDLQDEVKKIKKAEKLARKNKQQKKEEALKSEQEKTTEIKVPQKVVKKEESWFDYVAAVWRYPLALISSLWDYGMSFFVTKKVAPKVAVEVSSASEKIKAERAARNQEAKKKVAQNGREEQKKISKEKIAREEKETVSKEEK